MHHIGWSIIGWEGPQALHCQSIVASIHFCHTPMTDLISTDVRAAPGFLLTSMTDRIPKNVEAAPYVKDIGEEAARLGAAKAAEKDPLPRCLLLIHRRPDEAAGEVRAATAERDARDQAVAVKHVHWVAAHLKCAGAIAVPCALRSRSKR